MPYICDEERMCYALGLEEILGELGADDCTHTLERDLYCYINYDEVKKENEEEGGVMERSREFYAQRVLKAVEKILRGKTRKSIEQICDKMALHEALIAIGSNEYTDTLEGDLYSYITTEDAKEYYGNRILKALEHIFYFDDMELLEFEVAEILRVAKQ